MHLDIPQIRGNFPILRQTINGHPLVYLDSAATAQKPRAVLAAMQHFYEEENGNAHRSMHVLAERATVALEEARGAVQQFIGAARPEEILFTKNCTESLNLVARTFGRTLAQDDAIALTLLEHHSNILPWLQLKEEKGVQIAWIDIDEFGALRLDMLEEILRAGNVRLVTVTAQSNVLGVVPPLAEIMQMAHEHGALVCVDAAQAIAHGPIDVRSLDCDFLAFSGHKLYGPLGIGVLYGKAELLRKLPPFLVGGGVPENVINDAFTTQDIPQKFEAGTQPVAEAVGLCAAIEWLSQFSWKDIQEHEQRLLTLAGEQLRRINGLKLLGPWNQLKAQSSLRRGSGQAPLKAPVGCLSFTLDGIHPHDLTEILGRTGICLRAGHHCAQPLHKRLGITASTRLSVALYNTEEEIRIACGSIARLADRWTREASLPPPEVPR